MPNSSISVNDANISTNNNNNKVQTITKCLSNQHNISKLKTRFTPALQPEFLFLKLTAGSKNEVFCSLCISKFSVASRGRANIVDHINSAKHVKGAKQVQGN